MKFKVLPLAMTGIGSRIFQSGDIVTEDQFDKENIPRLILKGFLHPLDDNEQPLERAIITHEDLSLYPGLAQLGAVPGDFTYHMSKESSTESETNPRIVEESEAENTGNSETESETVEESEAADAANSGSEELTEKEEPAKASGSRKTTKK